MAPPAAHRRAPARAARSRGRRGRGRPGQVLADARPAAGPPGRADGKDLIRYAGELGLDTDRFTRDLRNHAGQAKIAADVDSADLSGVSGTPTFFVNGKRHQGAYDISTLSDAVRTARTRILISSPGSHGAHPDQLSPQAHNPDVHAARPGEP